MSDWLSSPGGAEQLLWALQSDGWIRRGKSPDQSRFWHLLTDEQAPMFGVFDGYEKQLLSDWIQSEASPPTPAVVTNRFRRRPAAAPSAAARLPSGATVEHIIAHHAEGLKRTGCAEGTALFDQLAGVDTKAQALAFLKGMLSPANHPTPAGLAATRLYADLFNQ